MNQKELINDVLINKKFFALAIDQGTSLKEIINQKKNNFKDEDYFFFKKNIIEILGSNLSAVLFDFDTYEKHEKFKNLNIPKIIAYEDDAYNIDNVERITKLPTNKSIDKTIDDFKAIKFFMYYNPESPQKINNKKNILIYGFGGTGEAIYRTFNKMFNKSKFIIVSSKKKIRLGKRTKHKKTIECKDLFSTDLFINCSPLGSNLKKGFLKKTPLNVNQIKKMKKKSTIFDIIYNPTKTLLSKNCKKLNIKYINGKKMNTLQAKRALNIIESQIKKNND